MRKPKLKSSMGALQFAISSLRPAGTVSLPLAKTDSFRAATATAASLFADDSTYYDTSTSSSSSNSIASSSLIPDCDNPEAVPRGPIASGRFFFSPSTSRSIMDELSTTWFSGNSVQMALCSKDPYSDFRSSMEEMVAAMGVIDWRRLQELLDCYLKLNERRTHNIILLAFVDLIVSIIMASDCKHDLL